MNNIKEELIKQARLELARRDFFDYCKLMAPDFYKQDRKFLKDVCHQLQDFYKSNEKICVINMPPRHGKSRTAGKLVEWILGINPKEKIMTGSYNETLSGTFAKSVRDTIASEKTEGIIVYNDVFPNTRIKYGEASSSKWALEGSGQSNYLATSPTGTATGFGCFPKGTKIYTNKGIIDIEKLYKYNKNDIQVLSFDHKNNIIRYNKIISKRRIMSNEIIKITTNTGRTIKSTKNHRYYIEGKGYIEAERLRKGDKFATASRIAMRKMWKTILQEKIRIFKKYQNVWCKRETNKEQEIWDNIEFINTSQGRKQTKQPNDKFDNTMQTLPYQITQNEEVTKIEYINKRIPVYDIQIENDENFYANGILVHNCTLMIIDDLIKNVQEAYNENVLQKQIDWFNNTMLSRTENGFKLIIIMTRWASMDLAGYILENYEDVRHINYKAVQEDGSMLCKEVLSKEDYELKTKNMNKDIIYANYQQEPIDIKNRLYSKFKTYEKLPPAHYIMNYTDTADEGNDYLCSIDYLVYQKEYYILDIVYTQEAMEITEPAVAKMMTKDHVGYANIESNNGGRGFARNVQRELKELNNSHTKIHWFHQSENKQARILSNSTAVMNNIYFPINWEDRFPQFAHHIKHYIRDGKNEHDDAEDCLTGVYENPKPNTISFGYNKVI